MRQRGVATEGLFFPEIPYEWSTENGYLHFRDGGAKAPYVYHPEKKFFASFDDQRPGTEKTHYVEQQGMGGIMFWQLGNDNEEFSLLDAIDAAIHDK